MKYKKTKILTFIAIIATLCTVFCSVCSASWSAANAFNTGGEQVAKNVYFRNHLDLHLVSENTTDTRTYYGDVYIEDLGNTYLNPLEYYDTNTSSSEMETLFGLTYLGTGTDQVGYSYYQTSLQNVALDNFGGTAGEYTGVGMTCYGFPYYNYNESHYRFKSLTARDYLQHMSPDAVGGQNLRVFFPNEAAYVSLYNSVNGTDGQEKYLLAYHTYNIYGFYYGAGGTLEGRNKVLTYSYGIPLPPSYASLPKMYEPSTSSTLPYLHIPLNIPYSSLKAFCEREFAVYTRAGYVQIERHSIEFTQNRFISGVPVPVEIDFAGTILGVLDNQVSTINQTPSQRRAYNNALAGEFKQAVEDIDFGTWIGNAVSGFFSVEIIPSVTFMDIFAVGVSLSLLLAFLKMFAGG